MSKNSTESTGLDITSDQDAFLVGKLRQLVDLVATDSDMAPDTPAVVIARLVVGMDMEHWHMLAEQHGIREWLALPVSLSTAQGIAALRDRMEELAFQRDHDALTTLPNRRYFDRQIELELERAGRLSTPLSLVMLDLDHFKRVNDTYGHACGDEVLRRFGAYLTGELRPYDLAARIGGEEFAVILPGTTVRQATKQAERLIRGLAAEVFECDGKKFSTTISAGVAGRDDEFPGITAQQLMANADSALYEAKAQGRNTVRMFKGAIKAPVREALVRKDEKKFLFAHLAP